MSNKIDLFSPRQLSRETGIAVRNILVAIHTGQLRCLKLNKRNFKVRSIDAARWITALASDHPAQHDITKANLP